jgi:magnesium-transporting ATPase (P-type)
VPADIILLGAEGLHCEVAALTGESAPVENAVDCRSDVPLEARNLVFASTLVVAGEGWGLVVRTGDSTLIGCIAGAAGAGAKHRRSLLGEEMARLVGFVCAMSLATGCIFLAIGLGRSLGLVFSITQAFILTIVANVPEGLPASVISSLALAQKRCAARRVVVKEASSLLTLGAISVLCTDKTGTLTQNRMTVTTLWVGGAFVAVVGAGAEAVAAPIPAPAPAPAAPAGDHVERTLRGRRLSLGGGTAILHSTSLLEASALRHWHHHTEAATGVVVPPGPALRALHGALARQRSLGPARALQRAPSWHPFAPPAGAPGGGGAGPHAPLSLGEDGAALRGFDGGGALAWGRANTFTQLLAAAAVCNRAVFAVGRSGALLGDASDVALARFADAQRPLGAWRAALPVVFSVPFSSSTKTSLSICELPGKPGTHLLLLKGAPERVAALCGGAARDAGGAAPVDDAFHADFLAAYERFAAGGGRVLGFAARTFPARAVEEYAAAAAAAAAAGGHGNTAYPTAGLEFLGIASLTDPPRPGVPEAVAACRVAGIRVCMITGDHPLTAEAIARQVGLVTLPTEREMTGAGEGEEGGAGAGAGAAPPPPPPGALVLTGFALSEMGDAALAEALRVHEEVVFARTSPEQKCRIVAAYQAAGSVVAVTGDGTNDAPALRRADVGVAMGSPAGSDVAREAADVIVLDDDFVSIVESIRLGRNCFNNLRKVIAYTVSHAIPELVPVFCLLVFDVPQMLSTLNILVVDLITEQLPAVALISEPCGAASPPPPPTHSLCHAKPTPPTPPSPQGRRGPHAPPAAQRGGGAPGGRAARVLRIRGRGAGGEPALRGRVFPRLVAARLPDWIHAIQSRLLGGAHARRAECFLQRQRRLLFHACACTVRGAFIYN